MTTDFTIKELKELLKERKERLKELKEQDEGDFSDFDLSIKGKKVNIPLVKNHIKYYQKKLDMQTKNSLLTYF